MAKKQRMSLKRRTMSLTGWTSQQYDREYDKFRNRVRTYEKTVDSPVKRSPAQVFYYTQKEMKRAERAGVDPKLSQERVAIMVTPARSSGAALIHRVDDPRLETQIKKSFSGLIEKSNIAQGIMDDNKLTIQEKYQKLKDYAKKIADKKFELNEKAKEKPASVRTYDFEELYGYDVEL